MDYLQCHLIEDPLWLRAPRASLYPYPPRLTTPFVPNLLGSRSCFHVNLFTLSPCNCLTAPCSEWSCQLQDIVWVCAQLRLLGLRDDFLWSGCLQRNGFFFSAAALRQLVPKLPDCIKRPVSQPLPRPLPATFCRLHKRGCPLYKKKSIFSL